MNVLVLLNYPNLSDDETCRQLFKTKSLTPRTANNLFTIVDSALFYFKPMKSLIGLRIRVEKIFLR